MIPQTLKKYFWDTDFSKLDLKRNKTYIIERLMEFGDEEGVQFLKKKYSEEELRETLKISRGLSPRSASFWAIILNVPKEKILCLTKQFREISGAIWKQ